MPDAALSHSHRKVRFDDLHRVSAAFGAEGRQISSGDRVSLSPQDDVAGRFLDGNVHASSVQLVPSRLPPFTGTNWQIVLNPDGTWSFLNQGHPARMLAGAGSVVNLGTAALIDRFDATRWLIYRDLAGFRLRPCMRDSGWLARRGEGVALAGRAEPVSPAQYWTIAPMSAAF